jgi:outer membrane receptor for ferrienterochelin and colicins
MIFLQGFVMGWRTTSNKKLPAAILLSALILFTAIGQALAANNEKDLTELSIEDLMNVDIKSTATLTDTKPRLVPAAVTTVTDAQIKASGARSLFELLDIYVPNLQIIRHHWESDHIGLRGIINDRDDKYLLLVNGKVINEHTHFGALTERDLVLLQDIHHIDIVRGPGSALYGPGAVAMVINIITYNANTFKGTEITGRLGAVEEFYSGEVKHGQSFDNNDGGFFIYTGAGKNVGASQYDAPEIYSHTFSDGSYDAGDTYRGPGINRDKSSTNDPIKVHAQLTMDKLDIWGRYTRGGQEFVWSPGGLFLPPVGYGTRPINNNSWLYQQFTGFIGYTQELSKNTDIDYAFSYLRTEFSDFRQGNTTDDPTNAYREDEYYGKVLLKWQPNDQHKLAVGSEVSFRELGRNTSLWPHVGPHNQRLGPDMPRWDTEMYSLLGEWQWNLSDQWTTFLGGRVDKHTYTDNMYSPHAAVVYSPTNIDTLKLMWSRSVRANNEEEMKAQHDTDGSNSEPEKLDSVEFRYERQQSKNLDLAASVFIHYNFELISYSATQAKNTTIGTEREYGFELEASYHTEKTRLIVSHGYTKLYGFNLEPGENTYITAKPYGFGNDLANWSNHITKLTAEQKLNDQWTFDASFRIYWGFPGMKDYEKYYPYVGGSERFVDEGWEKSYRGDYFLNLGLRYQPTKNLTIGVTGYNLLGMFNKDFNKRNYMAGSEDYRCEAAAVGVMVSYKF